MDDIKRPNYSSRPRVQLPTRRPVDVRHLSVVQSKNTPKTPVKARRRTIRIRFVFSTPAWLRRPYNKVVGSRPVKFFSKYLPSRRKRPSLARVGWALLAVLMIGSIFIDFFNWHRAGVSYALSPRAQTLLGYTNPMLAQSLKFDTRSQVFQYNEGYKPGGEVAGQGGAPKFSGSFHSQAAQGVTLTDPVTQVSIGFKPQFSLAEPKQDQNRLVYPLNGRDAVKVFSLRSIGMKEDIILNSYQGDGPSFAYKLDLPAGTEARLESNGALAVYGVQQELLGNVTTGSENDAKLLQKARDNAPKKTLLFTFPAPFVREFNKKVSDAKAWFTYKDGLLTLHTSGLKDATYPLSVDPSVYIETAAKLMRGNNETNVDFDVDNELIQKSQTTGARIDEWTSTNNLSTAVWGQGTAVAGGYIYSAGGSQGGVITKSTYYAAGTTTFNVPSGVASLTVQAWGAGGGAGESNGTGVSGDGGGGGYAKAVISVTPAESLDVLVGTGGAVGPVVSNGGGGGNGGGYSALKRGATFLVQAGGGGGGGGSRGSTSAGDGGAGGGATAVAGGSSTGGGGGAGSGSAGAAGTAGTGGTAGSVGAANGGGNAGGSAATCSTAVTNTQGGAGGTGAGGAGGDTTTCEGGGGGGGGRFGGGGGGSAGGTNNRAAGGGGGGSSLVTGSSTVQTTGTGRTPGNDTDANNNGAGNGGVGAASAGSPTAGAAGGVVLTYTVGSPTVTDNVSWAKFNTGTNAIESPNPGTGACSGWCNNSVYNLPAPRKNLSLLAYNGYLYAIGGQDSSCTTGNGTGNSGYCSTVYIAKLGSNGEPQLWHPSGGTPAYWYSDTTLSAPRSMFAAVAYNNHIYILGGLTTSNAVLSSNTVMYADIKPMGTLTTWTATGMSALTSARYGSTAQVYNDVLYIIGGDATFTGTPITTVQYARLNSDGTMNGWVTTSSMLQVSSAGRMTMGGSFSTVWGGYIYVGGGCLGVNGSGYCTSIASDVQLASINADGSLSEWNTILNLDNTRIGHTLIAWQGGLYRLGGCRAQDASSGDCTDTVLDVDYGVVNEDGEASTVGNSSASTVTPCVSPNPYSCDLPSASVGNMLNASIIVNGYLYIMGGCTNNACTTLSSGITYQSIGSDGTLQKPASCAGTYTDSYCVSSVTLPAALAAPGTAVFNGRIYLVGGFPSITNISHISVGNDGSLGTWTNTDFTDIALNGIDDDLSYTFAYARANPSSAGSVPGNLYVFGGCTGTTTGIGCSAYSDSVYKCNLNTAGVPSNCTITGQVQIGTVTGGSSSGLGAHAGAVYANYIYLMGGLAPGITDLTTVRYAKFDDSNNVVTAGGSGWVESASQILVGRRRGAGFGYNGHLYVTGGYDGSDALADIEFAKINVSTGDIGAFSASTVSINRRWGLTVPVSNSYAYVIGGCTAGAAPSSCSTRTNTIQTFQVYNNDSGAVKSVTSMSDDTFGASTDRWGTSAAVLNGYMYVAGGCIAPTDCSGGAGGINATADVQYAAISATDGSIGTWASTTKGIGDSGSGGQPRAWGKLVAVGGYLYYLGGQDSVETNEQSAIYYVQPSSGNITANWATATKGIGDTGSGAQARTKFGVAVWNNRIYVVGGLNGSAAVTNTVYISPQLNSGGNISSNWTSDSDVPDVARFGGAVTAYANNLYVFGGNDGTNYLNDAQFTQINSDGTVDAWTFTTSTPGYISQAEAFGANGYIYLVAGRSAAASCAPNALIAPVSANTTIATGNNPTGVGEWYETNMRYAGGRYGSAVAYDKGKLYVMGGGCTSPQAGSYNTGTIAQTTTTVTGTGTTWTDNYIGGTITYADASTATIVSVASATSMTVSVSKTVTAGGTYTITVPRHVYSVLKSQPQVAKYSRMIDTDTDVFPNSWLMNGLDNSIGARWQVKYRTMHDLDGASYQNPNEDCGTSATMPTMTTWGQETNFGDATLGKVETYSPLNSSGGNINCARYYYFAISIDASQTFGYPEDVSRGPTIYDISLFFTSDPSKRLRHGKTFTGGEQQPLDTPCRVSGGGSENANCPLP